MDPTEHTHIPYVIILVRVLEDWKKTVRAEPLLPFLLTNDQQHNGNPPQSSADKDQFKKQIASMKIKVDEENFDEALGQAYRAWTSTTVPSEIAALFTDPVLTNLTPTSGSFFHLLSALHEFTLRAPYTLPLSSALPDMKSDTKNYIHLQKLYKAQSEIDKAVFKTFIKVPVANDDVDTFIKNAHGLKLLRGTRWGAFDEDKSALGTKPYPVAHALI